MSICNRIVFALLFLSETKILLHPVNEPEVMLLVTAEQIKNLVQNDTSDSSVTTQYSALDSFGTALKQLGRPVTCIFLTDARQKLSDKKPTCVPRACSQLSLNQLCAQLQIHFNVHTTRVCSTVQDAALILASYTQSIAERPFKEGRLFRDEGFRFLPDTIRMGLSSCASRGRGAGPAPNLSNGLSTPDTEYQAIRAWANRVWLSQLGQWRGLTGEIAHAITLSYPTARAFFNACHTHDSAENSSKEFPGQNRPHPLESSLADLEIRRGAGLLASRRRLGPEIARRLITHFTVSDPSHVIY